MATEKNELTIERLFQACFEGFDDEKDDEYPDTEGIGYHAFGDRGFVGYIETVNGSGAKACCFEATHHELQVLAKHWYRQRTAIDLSWILYETNGSTEWRTAVYATRRIRRIRARIGDDLVNEAIAEVDDELCEQLGESDWERFNNQR